MPYPAVPAQDDETVRKGDFFTMSQEKKKTETIYAIQGEDYRDGDMYTNLFATIEEAEKHFKELLNLYWDSNDPKHEGIDANENTYEECLEQLCFDNGYDNFRVDELELDRSQSREAASEDDTVLYQASSYPNDDAVLYQAASDFTNGILRGRPDFEGFTGEPSDIQYEVIDRLRLSGKMIQRSDGEPIFAEDLPPEEFFKALPHLGLDSRKVFRVLSDSFCDALVNSRFMESEMPARNGKLEYSLKEAGLLGKTEPYLIFHEPVDYQKMPSYQVPVIRGMGDLLDALQYEHKESIDSLEITRFHDAPCLEAKFYDPEHPMGRTSYIIPQKWLAQVFQTEYMKDIAKDVRTIMDSDVVLRGDIYDAVPQLYQGKEEACALRDYVTDHLFYYGVPSSDKALDYLAEDILAFRPEGLRERCEKDPQQQDFPVPYPSSVLRTCKDNIGAYMHALRNKEAECHPFRRKEAEAVTQFLQENLAKRDFQKIGDFVEAVVQEEHRKETLRKLPALKDRGIHTNR